jgi:hypothetical protein
MVNNRVEAFQGPSHNRKISSGEQMPGGQDQSQNLAQRQLSYGHNRVTEDCELTLCPRKLKPHLGELVSVVVELSERYSEVFGNLFRRLVWLSPYFNDNAEKARKAVTLHEKILDFGGFKVKAKKMGVIVCLVPTRRY